MQHELAAPSLYDEAIRLLARRGFQIAPEVVERDWTRTHRTAPSVLAAWQAIYRDPQGRWDLYELAEELVDLEDWFCSGAFAI